MFIEDITEYKKNIIYTVHDFSIVFIFYFIACVRSVTMKIHAERYPITARNRILYNY